MKVAVGLRRVAAGKRTSGRRAAQIAPLSQRVLCRQIYPLEAKISKNKDLYYDVLRQAQFGWHDGTEDAVPFINLERG